MFPILYEQITAGEVPSHNGIGTLSDAISCRIEQERNGAYQLTLEYPSSGIHAEELALRRIIKAKPNPTDDPQLFRIDRIGKILNGKFTVYAKHISYDLSGYEISSGTASSAVEACALLEASASGYTITTDKTATGSFSITEPSSVRSWFGGKSGSFLDVFGTAELKYDNFDIQFLLHAGEDRNVTIRYGKNLLELSQEIGDTVYTDVVCFYKDEDNMVIGSKISTGLTLDVEKTLILDFSDNYDYVPTNQQLTQKAIDYINSNNLTTPSNNIKLDFVQSGELTNRVDLCDTVTVYYEALGISRAEVKCIRTVYDCIREKYVETEFGDARTNITDSMIETSKTIAEKPSKSYLAEAVDRATKLITGNLGGYVIFHDSNGDGEPDEILIMDEDDISTATKVWRFNKNGLGYSNTGYDGEYGLAMTVAGEIVADFITVGTMSGNRIRTGSIVSQNNQLVMDLDNGTITAPAITLQGQDVGSTLNELVQTSVETRYALSNSGTVIPDTFPLTAPTQPTEQQPYLWTRTEYTYANGQTNTSYSVSVRGADGADGADGAGLNILGNYATMADLIADHPTGSAGDAYMVDVDLVVWNTQTSSWQDVGRIQGASGMDGLWLTIENDDDGTNANVTYTAHLFRGVTDVTSSYDAIFVWQMIKEEGITELANDTSTITVSRDSANLGATIRCICLAISDEEDLQDYSYDPISDYSNNVITVIGTNNFKLIGDSAIYKPYAISSQFQVLQEEISSKVEQTDFNSLAGTVTQQGTAIQQNANQIALKANQSTVNTLSNTVSQQGTAIDQNAQQIQLKANTSTVNSQLNGKMATNMSNRASSIVIDSGKIQFDSDSIVINSTNLQVTQTGQVTSNYFKAKNALSLVNGSNVVKASLEHTGNNGTRFYLYETSAQSLVDLYAYDGRGWLSFHNSSGKEIVSLGAGGLILSNNSGNQRARMWNSLNDGGVINLANSSNVETITCGGDSGWIYCVKLIETSSRKVKDNIKPMTDEDADKILDLEAVSFDFKDKSQGINQHGFIAEDVAEILPNLVMEETETRPASLDYIGMIPYLVKLVQKQQKEIDYLKSEIEKLKGE